MNSFDDFMEQFFIDPFTSYLDQQEFRIDIFETNDEYQVEAELTDYDKDSIEVHAFEDGLRISAYRETKTKLEDKKNNCYRSEESYSSVQRFIPLPFKLATKRTKAVFENGILTVHVFKNGIQKSGLGKIEIK